MAAPTKRPTRITREIRYGKYGSNEFYDQGVKDRAEKGYPPSVKLNFVGFMPISEIFQYMSKWQRPNTQGTET